MWWAGNELCHLMRCAAVVSAAALIDLCICHTSCFPTQPFKSAHCSAIFGQQNLFFLNNHFLEADEAHITLRFIVFLRCAQCWCKIGLRAMKIDELYRCSCTSSIKQSRFVVLYRHRPKGNARYGIAGWWPTKPASQCVLQVAPNGNYWCDECLLFATATVGLIAVCHRSLLSLLNGRCKVLKNQCDIDCHFVIDIAIGSANIMRTLKMAMCDSGSALPMATLRLRQQTCV